jgi:linoleoyl-CoA desaturase
MKQVYKAVEDQLKINHRSTIALLVIKFLVYLVLVAFFYILIYTTSNPLLFFLVFVLYGFSAVLFGFNYAHDFSHNTVFKNKQLNNA